MRVHCNTETGTTSIDLLHLPEKFYDQMLSGENQKGINAVQQCSVESQKGAMAIDFVQQYSALLVLNRALWNSDNALLVM